MNEPKWLDVARKEMGVKEIVGQQDNPRIIQYHQETSLKASDDETAWCLTGDVEILTDTGWQRFDCLDKNSLVAQIIDNNKDLRVEFVKPISYIEKEYNDDVYEIKNRGLNLICDKDHQFFGYWNVTNRINLVKQSLDKLSTSLCIPSVKTSIEEDNSQYTDNDLKLIAAFLSDGSIHNNRIQIQVSKERKKVVLDSLNPDRIYRATKIYGTVTKTPLTMYNFKIPGWYELIFSNYKEPSYQFLYSLSYRQLVLFIETYNLFDGWYKGEDKLKNNPYICTSKEYLRDWLITAVTLSGYIVNVQKKSSKLSGKPNWAICWSKNKKTKTIRSGDVKKYKLETKLYCVEVPSGLILIKDKNHRPIITGNCSAFVNWVMKQSGLKGTNNAAARSWLNWGVKLDKPQIGCVVIFERGNSNWQGHVCFYLSEDSNNIQVLGGNQNNQVCIASYPKARLLGYRWPTAKEGFTS